MKRATPSGGSVAPLFEGLGGRPRRLTQSQVARHQRERLVGAMIEVTARHGYAGVTLQELVSLAGVSKSTFYELFASKEDCFLAAFDDIVGQTAARAAEAYGQGAGPQDGLQKALRAYADLIVARPAAASLVLVESLSLGTAAAEHGNRGVEGLEELLRQALAGTPGEEGVSDLTIRGIAGGIRRVAYRRLREERPERFGEQAEELADWALRYEDGSGPTAAERTATSEWIAAEPVADAEADTPDWEEPPSSARSRAELNQRERIVRAAARLSADRGYASLSVPAISGAAGVSNQTFYQEFAGKQEAFLAAFDALVAEMLAGVAPAFAAPGGWAERIQIALRAGLSYVATHPTLARFAFFELPAAGPAGRDASEHAVERAMAFLGSAALPAEVKAPTDTALEAIGGGVWAIVQSEIIADRTGALPGLAPQLLDFMLASLSSD